MNTICSTIYKLTRSKFFRYRNEIFEVDSMLIVTTIDEHNQLTHKSFDINSDNGEILRYNKVDGLDYHFLACSNGVCDDYYADIFEWIPKGDNDNGLILSYDYRTKWLQRFKKNNIRIGLPSTPEILKLGITLSCSIDREFPLSIEITEKDGREIGGMFRPSDDELDAVVEYIAIYVTDYITPVYFNNGAKLKQIVFDIEEDTLYGSFIWKDKCDEYLETLEKIKNYLEEHLSKVALDLHNEIINTLSKKYSKS